VGRDSSVGIQTSNGLDGLVTESRRFQWPSGLGLGSAADLLLGFRVRIPPGAWMFVSCVVSKDKKPKCRTTKTKRQLRMKYRVKENINKSPCEGEVFRTCPDRPRGPPNLLNSG
jgi:hypothetical protein